MSKSWNLTCSTSIHPFSKLLFPKSTSTHQEHANRPFRPAETQTTVLLVVRQQSRLLKHHTALLSVWFMMLKTFCAIQRCCATSVLRSNPDARTYLSPTMLPVSSDLSYPNKGKFIYIYIYIYIYSIHYPCLRHEGKIDGGSLLYDSCF